MVSTQVFAPGEEAGADRLARSVFVPADAQGTVRPVEVGPGCRIGAYAVIYGGTVVREGASIEEHALAGKPERGYAVGHVYPGSGAGTVIGERTARMSPAPLSSVPVGMTVCLFHTAFLAHLPSLDRERFEHLAAVLAVPGRSTGCKPNPAATRLNPACG